MQALLFHSAWSLRVRGHPRCLDRCFRPDVLFKILPGASGRAGCSRAPQRNEAPPGIVYDVREILEGLQTSGVDAVMFRRRRIKMEGSSERQWTISSILSVAPKRKGP